MNQNVEDFIRSNREAFDSKQPSDKVWFKISESLFAGRSSSRGLLYWRAAAILFMALSAFLLFNRWSETKDSRLVLNEFKDVESFYIREISHKIELIENTSESETGLNGFTHDFQQLEAMYEVLKDEMRSKPSKKVKDALVLNLLIRIDLLNKQLEKIEQQEALSEDEEKESKVSA
jgi:hypothetical protein